MKLKPKPTTGTKKIRRGDKVMAISGNSRGLTGIVQSFQGNDKVIVQGLNMRKKHIKRSRDVPQGRLIELEEPIHVSNLKICVEGDTVARLRIRKDKKGDRQLVYKNGDKEMVYRSVKKPK